MALTTDSLRSILGAAIGPETNAYIDALLARQLVPADDTPLSAGSVAVALLAVLCGEQPRQAPSATLQLAGYCLLAAARAVRVFESAEAAMAFLGGGGTE